MVFLACFTEDSQQCLQMPRAPLPDRWVGIIRKHMAEDKTRRWLSCVWTNCVGSVSGKDRLHTSYPFSPFNPSARPWLLLLKGFIKTRSWHRGHIGSAEVAQGSGLAQLTQHLTHSSF